MRYCTGSAEPCTVLCKRVEQVRSSSLQKFVRTVVNECLTLPSDKVKLTLIQGTVQAQFYYSWLCWLILFYNLPNASHGIKCGRLTFNSFWLTPFKGTWRHHSNRHNLRLPYRNMGRFSGNCSVGWTIQVSQFIYQSVLSTPRNSSSTNEKTPDWRGNLYRRRYSTFKHITHAGLCHEMLEFYPAFFHRGRTTVRHAVVKWSARVEPRMKGEIEWNWRRSMVDLLQRGTK